MKKLQNDLLGNKYTEVSHEKEFQFNAPHTFIVKRAGEHKWPEPINTTGINDLAKIHFQEGPIKENGVNGVCNEDLIAMVLCRLEHFQNSPYGCRENALAITKLEEAMLWLRKRTLGRDQRGVEGTSEV